MLLCRPLASNVMATQTRMDDQRSYAPGPGDPVRTFTKAEPLAAGAEPMAAPADDESFFDMLATMQQPRLDYQRSSAPDEGGVAVASSANASLLHEASVSVLDELDPENMSFFEMMAAANKSAA